jgi:hypothetical protein
LYNAIGRVRQFRIDAMIAGCAISAGAPLATSNTQDFRRFVPYGLTLIPARPINEPLGLLTPTANTIDMAKLAKLVASAPVLLVKDVVAGVNYYREKDGS